MIDNGISPTSTLTEPSDHTDESVSKTEDRTRVPSKVSLKDFALAAVASCVNQQNRQREDESEFQYLLEFQELVASDALPWHTHLATYLRRPAVIDLPYIHLVKEFGLTLLEVLAIAVAVAVEQEVMVGRALAKLQAPVGGSRPTLGLLATALAQTAPQGMGPVDLLANGVAVRSGLINLIGEGTPLPERAVSVPQSLRLAVQGQDGVWTGTSIGLEEHSAVPLSPSTTHEAEKQAKALCAESKRVLVIRSGSNLEAKSVAEVVAAALNARPVFIETDQRVGLAPWLILRKLLPVFRMELAPGEGKVMPTIPLYHGAAVVICGPDGSVDVPGGTAVNWYLEVPSLEERRDLWNLAINDQALSERLARAHRHSTGRIAHLGKLAHHRCALEGRQQPTQKDIEAAAWDIEGTSLEALAQPMKERINDEAMVTTPSLRQDLNTLLLRCRSRDGLVQGLGASAQSRYHPGVRALFVGPSGTGKTMAVGWIATQLGLPMYRVDLASLTSKYIGETEKNLAQLMARAEHAEVVLLFDEADSVFGKRTDIKESNDRFANAQTNYLLQRIESFDGIVILTSNSRGRFDTAFYRRLDMIVDFPLPGPEERRAMWRSHLGDDHQLEPRDLNRLAVTANVCGGHIRNAVLAAAVVAQTEKRTIQRPDIVHGLRLEYRKLGKQLPAELETATSWKGHDQL